MWGTCQGFQQLNQWSVGMDPVILHSTGDSTENVALALEFTAAVADSGLLGSAPQSIVATLGNSATTLNLHSYSVLLNESQAHPVMADTWSVLATNAVEGGPTFISLMEGKTLPYV